MTFTHPAAAHTTSFGAPSWLLLGAEPLRAFCELASTQFMNKKALPKGDGHPVVLFPGLAADASAMGPMRDMCRSLGYAAHDWGRGFNTGTSGDVDEWLDALTGDVGVLSKGGKQRISLVGWSLGGIFAREVAKKLGPGRVRQVISLGTPFTGNVEHTAVGMLYRMFNGAHPRVSLQMVQRLGTPPDVPTTSIYSRSDGVVAWQACLQPCVHSRIENIEVSSSHSGLAWNADVFAIVADRLAQPTKVWRPYQAPIGAGQAEAA